MEIRKKAHNEEGGGGLPVKGWISGGGGLMKPSNTPVHTRTLKSLITCLICCNDGTCAKSRSTWLGCANNLVKRYLMLMRANHAACLASC